MKKEEEICTRPLSEAEVRAVIDGLPALIKELVGDCIVNVEYGWACNIHINLQYQTMDVGISWLDRFLSDSINQSIYRPAKSDLTVATPDNGLKMQFCHESDIHLSGQDANLVQRACKHDLLRNLMKREVQTSA
ncbi:MAG: hypothetical protein KBA51_04890 [Kiritimatiellae bacterium]|nr:hypothetical protein [Kiritimatiellia bacterium]